MIFEHNDRTKELIARVEGFMDAHIYPNEITYHQQMDAFRADGNPWQVVPILEELKDKAKEEGKCGEGKCGGDKAKEEGKCGEGKCGGDKTEAEGKCGEGKCGGAS